MSLQVIRGTAMERTGPILLARILGHGGFPVTQATFSSLSYEVWYKPKPEDLLGPTETPNAFTPVKVVSETSLTIANVIYDTLQTGPTWIVTVAAPAVSGATTIYVHPLQGDLPVGTVLEFAGASAVLTSIAREGDLQLSVALTGNLSVGDKAVAGTPHKPPKSPWKVDNVGYNFRFQLPASQLGPIPIEEFPEPRYYVVSILAVPQTGESFGWEYEIETSHRLQGK